MLRKMLKKVFWIWSKHRFLYSPLKRYSFLCKVDAFHYHLRMYKNVIIYHFSLAIEISFPNCTLHATTKAKTLGLFFCPQQTVPVT